MRIPSGRPRRATRRRFLEGHPIKTTATLCKDIGAPAWAWLRQIGEESGILVAHLAIIPRTPREAN